MNVTQLLVILAARWRIVALAAVLGLVSALLWVVIAPSRYTAAAQVLVDVRAPGTVNITGDPGVAPQLQPDYVATQVDVIRSRRVAMGAVDKLGILGDPDAMAQFRESNTASDPRTYFAQKLANDVRVVPAEGSRVVTIAYTTRSPQLASNVANAFADAYREVSVQLQREPALQAADDFKARLANVAKQLSDAQATLSARRAALGITATAAEGSDAEETRLIALSQQLAAAQAAQATENQRGAGGALPEALTSPVVQELQSEIAKVEAQRNQLATFAGPNNVDYRQLTERLSALRSQLGQARALVARGAATTSSRATASVRQLQGDIAAQRARVIANQRSRGGILALEENVSNLKQTYEALVARQSQSNLLGATDQSNVVVLARAGIPTSPAGLPNLLKLIAGLLLGLLFGGMLAIVAELFDHRLRQPEDATTWLGIPDLGGVRSGALGTRQGLLSGSTTRYLPRPSDWSAT